MPNWIQLHCERFSKRSLRLILLLFCVCVCNPLNSKLNTSDESIYFELAFLNERKKNETFFSSLCDVFLVCRACKSSVSGRYFFFVFSLLAWKLCRSSSVFFSSVVHSTRCVFRQDPREFREEDEKLWRNRKLSFGSFNNFVNCFISIINDFRLFFLGLFRHVHNPKDYLCWLQSLISLRHPWGTGGDTPVSQRTPRLIAFRHAK